MWCSFHSSSNKFSLRHLCNAGDNAIEIERNREIERERELISSPVALPPAECSRRSVKGEGGEGERRAFEFRICDPARYARRVLEMGGAVQRMNARSLSFSSSVFSSNGPSVFVHILVPASR